MRAAVALALTTTLALAAIGCDNVQAGSPAGGDDGALAATFPAVADVSSPAAITSSTGTVQTEAATMDIGFTLGDPDAPIAVVEFSDFGCPYCARFARTTLPTIRSEYIEPGTIRWRYVPVVFGFPGGELMGKAAVCAAQQGGTEVFWRVHDLFYARQQVLRGDDARPRILQWVSGLGVDRDRLDACIDSPATRQVLVEHTLTARRWYVSGTPTFVVNGVPMAGAAPIDFFRMVFATVQDPSGM